MDCLYIIPVRLPKREISDRQVTSIVKEASLGGMVVALEGAELSDSY